MAEPGNPTQNSVQGSSQSWNLKHLEARLEAERTLVLENLTGLRHSFQQVVDASTDSNADDEHDPEGATIAFERSQLQALIKQSEHHLEDLETARLKVTNRRYGLCERCGKPIGTARLDARPLARTCIVCAALRT
ncbi:MAG: DnaK suppressor protein [Actinomycetota bacterium]|jgi:RNA polymerase-binding transcription factor DksA|nr:DnaK suppressor protein [Actinomycetota bacterium]